ncbi:MAG TPA: hypothetical protein ENI23_10680 [bacterium]|nr:hypothetical protein [bacterium]
MGKIIEKTINTFHGGIVNDPRDPRENTARIITNFDAVTNTWKMSPYRDSEDGNSAASTDKMENFAIALRTGTTYSLYALGVVSGGGLAEISYKNLTTGSANDLDDADWTATANNADGSGSTNFNLFVYYQNQDLIYGASAGTRIWTYDPGGGGFTATEQALTYTNIAQGLVHSQDDILYVPYDNKIASNNAGSWSTTAATIPTHFYITSIAEYGNFLAIAAAPLSGIGNSRVFLWNRDDSVSTFSESIDWGEGVIQVLDVIDGLLVGISQVGGTTIAGPVFGSGFFEDRVIFRFYDQAKGAIQFRELIGGANTTRLHIRKQKIDNQLFFLMSIELNGAVRAGLWSIGRHDVNSPLAVVHERTPNNNTAWTTVSGDEVDGFIIVGDFTFIANRDGGVNGLSKTNDSSSYTATSIYESKIFNTKDTDAGAGSSLKKDLVGITVTTEPLPTAGKVVLKYAVDENIGTDTFTTIFTNTTDDSISNSGITDLPKDYKEIQFRIESTGNAEITGLSFKEEVVGKREYN